MNRVSGSLWRPIASALCLSLFVTLPLPASASVVDDVAALFQKGNYAAAEKLAKTGLRQRALAAQLQLALARLYIRTGRYKLAAAALRRAKGNRALRPEVGLLEAKLDIHLGNRERAIRTLSALLRQNEAFHRARVLLGLTLYDVGRNALGYSALDKLADFYNDEKIKSARDLTSLGRALHRNEFYRNANEVFGDAVKADPSYLPANVHWGYLFLDKYNYNDAAKSFEDVLKINPNHPDALIGMAEILLRSEYNRDGALKRIRKALAINPLHEGALCLKAEINLDAERYKAAIADLEPLLKLNPNHLRALTLTGTAYYLLDDAARFDAYTKRVLKLNPKYAELFHTAAEFGVKVHRYAEAIKLNERALVVNPKFWKSYVSLGINYSRVADDKKAKEYLEKAFENDPYNVRAYNMSAILFDKVFKRYELVRSTHITFRFHKEQSAILKRYAIPLVERAYRTFNKKYRFVPKAPLQLEIFKNPRDFAIRTVGLPRISVHGVCFGHVITSRSPSDGNFNWEQVLWHEMAHVYHIQLSHSRVPRWFTEGLAVYEATLAKPEWKREMDLVLYEALRQKRVAGIAAFNLEFTQAKNFKQILAAYYQAYVVMEFIDKTWGFAKIRQMLVLYGQKLHTPQIFKRVLGIETAEFDRRFAAFLKKKYGAYRGYFLADLDFYRDLSAYQKRVDKNPKDAEAWARLSVAQVKSGKLSDASASLARALKLDPKQPLANYLAANKALAERQIDVAKKHLETMVKSGHDGYYVRLKLAAIARAKKDNKGALAHLLKAASIVPSYPDAYRMLVGIYLKDKQPDKAHEVLRKLALIDQNSAGVVLRLAEYDGKRKKWRDVERWARMGMAIAPFRYQFHYHLGLALLETKRNAAALEELEIARSTIDAALVGRGSEQMKKPAALVYAALARVTWALGQKAKAREHVAKAKELAPQLDDVRSLETLIR
ncbi:MAG: tetratricopeptide repeat protein [Myxococcales bacterium]|nr:tetratricopeptide repeat protein [Myxococcales bacterium]